MKPLKLELQAFGPYVEKQTVNFETLAQKGIFLIKGDTGSGKTTLFDAMTFALYGGSSGEGSNVKNGRNDLEEWRCTQAPWKTETFVSFLFATHGRTYFFKRSLLPKKTNLSLQLEAGEVDEYGNVIPFFENPKINDLNKKAEELIGLTKEQFRQVILLPQGQFERFLTASSDEKQGILEKIFGVDRWQKYAVNFYQTAKDRFDQLDAEKQGVLTALTEEKAESLPELKQKIDELEIAQKQTEQAHQAFESEKKQKALEADRLLARDFGDLHKKEEAVRGLEAKKAEIAGIKTVYARAEKAEALRGFIEDYEKALQDNRQREAALAELKKKIPRAEEAEKTAGENLQKHEQTSPVSGLTKQIGEFESKRETYRNFESLKAALAAAEKACAQADTDCRKADSDRIKATGAAGEAKTAYDAADAEARDCRDRYFGGIYGEIAGQLAEGSACPVCGSPTHPHPAEKAADSVSKEAMDEAQKGADRKRKIWEQAEQKRQEKEKVFQDKKGLLSQAEINKQKALTEFSGAKQNLIDGISDEAALKEAIASLTAQIKKYDDESERLKKIHEKASQNLTSLKSSIVSAGEEALQAVQRKAGAETALQDALREQGYPDYLTARGQLVSPETRREMHERIVSYDTSYKNASEDLEKKRAELSGRPEPDASIFEEREREIKTESETYFRRTAELKTSIGRLSQKEKDLSGKWQHYKDNIGEAESDLALARKLRGDAGIGLQRYVLAVMFNQVIGEANRMLQYVHGGRYHLFRTDDRGAGNKRGLELKVHDNRSPEKEGRIVSLLSGGEKFLVSLALSIGMSTVAQKSGVQIEALFIDEGFGTLDNSSIQDAMDILENVRRSSGMIGIISHVQLLEDAITTKLHVLKRETGSVIVPE